MIMPKIFDDLAKGVRPADYGAVLWGGLHVLSREECFSLAVWLSYVDYMSVTVDPQRAPATGCSLCHAHFQKWMRDHPPEEVRTATEAQEWGWIAHNAVRKKKMRKPISFAEAIERWEW